MKNKYLSIICPVYNSKNTIIRLVECLECQTFKDYELILINDESTDDTLKILRRLEKKYNNIIVINQKNTGVGGARNAGLKISNGKYVTFIDNDDYHEKNFFENVIPILKSENVELLCYGFYVVNSDGVKSQRIPDFDKDFIVLQKNDGLKKYLTSEFSHKIDNVNWNKIYLNEIIQKNNIFFPTVRGAMEDLIFNMEYFQYISKIKLLNKKLCNYSLDFDPIKNRKYYVDSISYIKRCYNIFTELCMKYNFSEYERYLGLFFLRRVPAVIRNQSNNPSVKDGFKQLDEFIYDSDIQQSISKIKFGDLDLKLLICFVLYKLHLSKPILLIVKLIKKI